MKLGFLSKIFEGALSIEKTYNACDKAINQLRQHNENIKQMEENGEDVNSLPAAEKSALDEVVNNAITKATQLLNKESERNWPGVFREMHRNLGTIYLEQHEYDKAREKCEQLKNYGEVGRLDAEDLLQRVEDRETGKTDEATESAESDIPATER
jgi:tetratricopeptide (TPR) repeat protein